MIFQKAIRVFLVLVFAITYFTALCQQNNSIDSLKLRLEKAESDSSRVNINIELSQMHITTDLSTAMEYAENAVELAEKAGYSEMIAKSLNNIGHVCFNQGFYELALAHFIRCLDINTSTGNERGIASIMSNIGAINLVTENFSQAKQNFTGALARFKKLGQAFPKENYKVEIMTLYNNLGIACQNLKEYRQAEKYYQSGIDLAQEESGNAALLANLYNNLASLLLDLNLPDEAYRPVTRALDLRLKSGDKNGEAQSYRMFAIYYIAKGNKAKTFEFLYKGYRLAAEIGNKSLQANLVEKLFSEYQKLHEPDSALKYHILLKSLETELNSSETQRELARIELTAKFREREQLRELEQKKTETRYLLVGLGLLVTVSILGLLFLLSNNRLKRIRLQKDVIDLESKNLFLEKSALQKELEMRNKELTTNVMYLVQKNEYLTEIAEQLKSIKQNLPEEKIPGIDRLINDLKSNRYDNIWKQFEIRFQDVHQDFYTRLNERFPDLTPNEKKLAAFLRLNMTTKDISAITFQLPDSIKTARSRLRKKLGLSQEANLIAFLESI